MTDTTPSGEDITRAADGLYAALPVATRVIGDLSVTWPVMAGRVAALLADDAMPPDVRIMRARATLAAREVVADRMKAEDNAADRLRTGGFDWLISIFDEGQTFECGICGHRVRAFEDDQQARTAARGHLTDDHAANLADLLDAPDFDLAVDEDDDRCQPIGCDGGYHVPGCRYTERDTDDARGRECPHGFWVHSSTDGTCPEGCVQPDQATAVRTAEKSLGLPNPSTAVGLLALQSLGLNRPGQRRAEPVVRDPEVTGEAYDRAATAEANERNFRGSGS